jgi:outer membrane receptor protein involved in Fe transport
MSLNWELEIYGANALNLNVNISNLFDSRTYAVTPNTSGIETGRQFWLGINYAFN